MTTPHRPRTAAPYPLLLAAAALAAACRSAAPAVAPPPDLSAGPVALAAEGGWEARLLHAAEVGVWTVGAADVLARYAGDEVIALDDLGRCAVLSRYSGRTTAHWALRDGTWLGGLAHGDVDPTLAGPELYVGAQRGSLYQVWPHDRGGFDVVVTAEFPGREVHALAVFARDGTPRLYAGLSDGEVHELTPAAAGGRRFDARLVARDPGRVRQLAVARADGRDHLVYASRAGRLVLLRDEGADFEPRVLATSSQGFARVAVGGGQENGASVLYAIDDAGAVVRVARGADGTWSGRVIHRGPEGGRGIAAGRFDIGGPEAVAIFGYSGAVELLRPDGDGAWSSEVIFRDADRGHWLTAAELHDGNATTELLLSGYAGRVVLLRRPVGYGLD